MVVISSSAYSQTVIPALNSAEKPGLRPYEMVWAKRQEVEPPTILFDRLAGWTMEALGGARGVLQLSDAENIWNRSVGELRYLGDGSANSHPQIVLTPPSAVTLPVDSDCVDIWLYGNRWQWENPPDTPPVSIILHLKDAAEKSYNVYVDQVRWQQWWLLHSQLPAGMKQPVQFESMEISGGWQPKWRKIFIDSIRFYHENLLPLHFPPLPQRNLHLFPGQSPGANTGDGKLPFPTRETTILPVNHTNNYHNYIGIRAHNLYEFVYDGQDCKVNYQFDAKKFLSGLSASMNGETVGQLMDGAVVEEPGGKSDLNTLQSAVLKNGAVTARYLDGTVLSLRIWQKSLVVDVINRTRHAEALQFGRLSSVADTHVLYIPFLTYGNGNDPCVLMSKAGSQWVFTSIWPDWYRSNGSRLKAANFASENSARINGGVLYSPLTNGRLNPMYERLFITVSPSLEETLPTIANPVGLHAKEAINRLWQESWGPENYIHEEKRSEMLRAYGINKLIQCNHELTWRDFGESFTLRTHAAPGRGGDAALEKYVERQQSLGWLSGLYTNYSDFAPVNAHWSPDRVIRSSDGSWVSAWPRCWALKPLSAVSLDAEIAPEIERRYHSDAAYTDVMTAVAPWDRTDFDIRAPGAGSFAQTFYAYGQLLRNDSRAYRGPVFSEGTFQCFYAGLDDGNYGHTYNNRPLASAPLLPIYDLMQIHPKECDIGVSWTSFYCDAIPDWQAPQNIDRALDRFILTTMAYGHIGWLVEEQFGIERTCRSYYMLQQVQARYGLKAPSRIAYWNGKRLVGVSQAVEDDLPSSRRQIFLEYPGGLKLWLNDSSDLDWKIDIDSCEIILPPAGWAVFQKKDRRSPLFSYSALKNGKKVDYLRSDAYIFQDGRGAWFSTPDAASNGAMVVQQDGMDALIITRISGSGLFMTARPYRMQGLSVDCKTFDVNGKQLQNAVIFDSGAETWIAPVPSAVKYILKFTGKSTWTVRPQFEAAAPGSSVKLYGKGASTIHWGSESGTVTGDALSIPSSASAGTWIAVQGKSGQETRTTLVRVVKAVDWLQTSVATIKNTRLNLTPHWHLEGLAPADLYVNFAVSNGWKLIPPGYEFQSSKPPHDLSVTLSSQLPPGAQGELSITLTGAQHPSAMQFPLKRTIQPKIIQEMTDLQYSWGICQRGKFEEPNNGSSGAIFDPGEQLSVGGSVKRGIFMHPPYQTGVGYAWAVSCPVQIPKAACEFRSFVGIRDGGDNSDGVWFSIYVITPDGSRVLAGEQTGVQHQWRLLQADLSRFAGQRVRIMLKADVGPNNNSTADWGSWGQPDIQLLKPGVFTEVLPCKPE